MEFSALPFEDEDLDEGDTPLHRHVWDLVERDYTILDLDLGQMGLGGDTSWGARVHPEYLMPALPYRFSFRMTPLSVGGRDPAQIAADAW
jgi:beta-galactosidase